MTRRSRLVGELAILAAVLLALAIAAFAAVRLFLPPRLLAVEIGPSLDNALGPLVLRQVEISQRVLSNPAVDAAFSTIMDRLRPALDQLAPGSPKVRIVVLDCPTINAFALPGGIICVCTGLMRSLDSAEQMAAILGHELSHVVHRDPLTLLARQVGAAALVRALTGGREGELAGTLARTLVNVHYGREAEDRADAFSVRLLASADIDPATFQQALERIRRVEPRDPRLLLWIDTHSPMDERIARAAEQAGKLTATPRKVDVNWRRLIRGLPKTEE